MKRFQTEIEKKNKLKHYTGARHISNYKINLFLRIFVGIDFFMDHSIL